MGIGDQERRSAHYDFSSLMNPYSHFPILSEQEKATAGTQHLVFLFNGSEETKNHKGSIFKNTSAKNMQPSPLPLPKLSTRQINQAPAA